MRVFPIGLALLAWARPAASQSAGDRATQRFSVALGLGLGSATGNCDRCPTNEWTNGASGFVRLGAMLSSRLLLGLEGGRWQGYRDSNQSDEYMTFGSLTALWYLRPARGLFLKLGVGGMVYRLTNGTDELKTKPRPLASVGVGYELGFGQHLAIAPFTTFHYASSGITTLNGQPYPGYPLEIQSSLVQVGATVVLH